MRRDLEQLERSESRPPTSRTRSPSDRILCIIRRNQIHRIAGSRTNCNNKQSHVHGMPSEPHLLARASHTRPPSSTPEVEPLVRRAAIHLSSLMQMERSVEPVLPVLYDVAANFTETRNRILDHLKDHLAKNRMWRGSFSRDRIVTASFDRQARGV